MVFSAFKYFSLETTIYNLKSTAYSRLQYVIQCTYIICIWYMGGWIWIPNCTFQHTCITLYILLIFAILFLCFPFSSLYNIQRVKHTSICILYMHCILCKKAVWNVCLFQSVYFSISVHYKCILCLLFSIPQHFDCNI